MTDRRVGAAEAGFSGVEPERHRAETEGAGAGGAGVPEAGSLQRELEQAREELEKARATAEERMDHLLRLRAEFENYRKRVLKEQTALLERAAEALVDRLLPVLDNFRLAVLAAEATRDYEKMLKGVELVYASFLDVLSREGLEVIDEVGVPFDPAVHDAVVQVEGEKEEPVVVSVLRPGYRFKGRLLRAAMVKVARKGAGLEGGGL